MIALAILSILVVASVLAHFLWVSEKRLLVGPETFFLLMGVGTYFSTLAAAVTAGSSDSPYPLYIGCGVIAFVVGTAIAKVVLRFSHRRELDAFIGRPWRNDLHGNRLATVLGIGIFSIAVTAIYFYLLGFYVPYDALGAYLRSGSAEMMAVYNQLRGETSATGAYLAPGYVAQFRSVLLPLVTMLLFFRARARPGAGTRLLFWFFLAATVFGAMGTGGRYALAFFGGTFIILGMAPLMRPLRFSRIQMVVGGILVVTLLSAMTLMMGARGQDRLEVPILWAPAQVVQRIFVSPAHERFQVYERFLVDQEAQVGRGSLEELRQILPGRIELTLTNRLHQMLYGSPNGNVGLDYWGTTWYDFQWAGLLAALLHGFLLHGFHVLMIRGPKRITRVVTLGYAGLILGFATDLQMLVLHGFVSCLLLLGIVNFVDALARSSPQANEELPTTAHTGGAIRRLAPTDS